MNDVPIYKYSEPRPAIRVKLTAEQEVRLALTETAKLSEQHVNDLLKRLKREWDRVGVDYTLER